MSDGYLDNLLPDFGDYSLDEALEDCRRRASGADTGALGESPAAAPAEPAKTAEAIAARSRQIVMQALGETLSRHGKVPEAVFEDDGPDSRAAGFVVPGTAAQAEVPAPEDAPSAPEDAPQAMLSPEDVPSAPEDIPQDTPAPKPERPKPRIHVSADGVITMELDMSEEELYEDEYDDEEPDDTPEPIFDDTPGPAPEEADEEEEPVSGRGIDRLRSRLRAGGKGRRPRRQADETPKEDRPSAADRFLTPVIRMLATRLARRQMQKAEAANWPDPVEYVETEELPPKKASKFYGQQLRPLRFRLRVCFFLCIVLAWISLGLPMAGLLGRSLTVQAGVSLALLLTVMMAALDILAIGLQQLVDLRPGAEALAALASLMSAVDAVMVMAGYGLYLPFCAVGAFSLTAALWGERLDVLARARSMRAAAASSHPSAVTAQETSRGGKYICRSQRPVEGIVRRCEQADLCRTVYGTAAPILLLASLALAILASLDGQGAYFLHTLSALLCVSASFTAFLSFPLPYCVTAGKLQNAGAAIIGYAGAVSIGKARRVVISDDDLFPPGTMKLTAINILEGAPVEQVIAATASLLTASGSGAANVFSELMVRRKYAMLPLEEFRCHEGGGLSARIGGGQVLVGSAGFMNLMGIRIPQGMFLQNAVCTAMSGELVGVFNLEYTPKNYVQDALVTLLQGRTQPIFAIRDFNITPLMIRHLFRMPTENFNFPTFRDRYRITASAAGSDWPIAAVLTRGGMGPMVDAAEAGRKLYSVCRLSTVFSLVGTALGMITLFLLCRAGAFGTASAGNALSYMLLWALPVLLLAMSQNR